MAVLVNASGATGRPNVYWFDVPVYYQSPEKYQAKVDLNWSKLFYGASEQTIQSFTPYFEAKNPPWEFNQIVGYIRLCSEGHGQIKGEYWQIQAKKFTRLPTKQPYRYVAKICESVVLQSDTSSEILEEVLKLLRQTSKESSRLRRFTLDLRQLEWVGRYIDWQELLFYAHRRQE